MLWAIRQGDETKLERLVSRGNTSQQLEDMTLPKRDWDKIAGVQIVGSATFRRAFPDGSMEDGASVDTIVERDLTSDGKGKDVEMHRWTLIKTNDQWLIRFRF